MAKKQYQIDANDEVALKDDFTLGSFADYVSSLFSSVDTSTDPTASGLLNNATLDKGIVKVCNSIVGTPNAALEAILGTAS